MWTLWQKLRFQVLAFWKISFSLFLMSERGKLNQISWSRIFSWSKYWRLQSCGNSLAPPLVHQKVILNGNPGGKGNAENTGSQEITSAPRASSRNQNDGAARGFAVCGAWSLSRVRLFATPQTSRPSSSVHADSQGKNTAVGCYPSWRKPF